MAEVGTGADAGIVFLDGLQHVDRLVVAVCRAMIVDGHADVELLHEFVEAGEGVGSGIGAEGGEEGIREFLETRVISMPKPGVDG